MNIIDKIKNNKTLLNGSLFSLYSFFGQGVSFVLLIILAKYIMPHEYGYLSLFTTLTTVLGLFFGFSSSGYLSIVYFKKTRQEFNKDFSSIVVLEVLTAAIYFLALLIFGKSLSHLLDLPLNILYMGGIIVFSNKLFGIQQNLYRLNENLKLYGILSCSNAIINFLSAIFFVVYLNLNWIGRIYSMVAYSIIFGVIALCFFIKENYFSFTDLRKRFYPILLWSMPLIPHLATNWIKQGLDRYIINYHYSTYEVGIFSFAMNLTSIILSVGVAFNNSNSVALFKLLSSDTPLDDKTKVLRKSTKEFLLIYVAISTIVILGGTILTPLVFPKYSLSVPYFIILGIYGFLQCIYLLYCNYFFYYKKTKSLMYITFWSSILHLSLSLIFTRYSLYCTAFIYLISMAIVDYFVFRSSKKMLMANLK